MVYLKGSLEDADKVKIEEMAERIRVKEKIRIPRKKGVDISNIDYKESFEHYFQEEYDFNTSSLSPVQIKEIKQREK